MSKHIPWTPEEDARVVQLRQQGFQVRDVAAHLGRSTNSVSYRLRILKEQGKLPITDKQGKVVRELPTAKTSVDNFHDAVSEAAYEFENEALQAELKDLKQQIDQYENHTVTPLWDDDWDGPGEWSRAEKKSAKRIDKEIKRGKFNVSFPNGPIAISVISDQHIAPGSACAIEAREGSAGAARAPASRSLGVASCRPQSTLTAVRSLERAASVRSSRPQHPITLPTAMLAA